MSKIKFPKSKLSIENAPEEKKLEKPIKKLGIINKSKTKNKTYRMRIEVIEALEEIKNKVSKKVNIPMPVTQIIEILILDAVKNPSKLIKRIKA